MEPDFNKMIKKPGREIEIPDTGAITPDISYTSIDKVSHIIGSYCHSIEKGDYGSGPLFGILKNSAAQYIMLRLFRILKVSDNRFVIKLESESRLYGISLFETGRWRADVAREAMFNATYTSRHRKIVAVLTRRFDIDELRNITRNMLQILHNRYDFVVFSFVKNYMEDMLHALNRDGVDNKVDEQTEQKDDKNMLDDSASECVKEIKKHDSRPMNTWLRKRNMNDSENN